jgi:putative NIF3 family GTP cyclohydrolase 1 type 2
MGLTGLDEYFPIAGGIPGGAAVIGASDADVEGLVTRLAGFLGREIPVQIVTRAREEAGRVAVVAGGGADREMLVASLERGCQTYVTGNAASRCRLELVQESVAMFLELARAEAVTVIDGTHYGTEKPPQLAMVQWFQARGMPAQFVPDGPK